MSADPASPSTLISERQAARAMAEQLSLFGIVVGVALLLSGIGFIVLALGGSRCAAASGRHW